jgi:toxin ParE1/3/4
VTAVIWTLHARSELHRAFTHIAKDNPIAAKRVRDDIETAGQSLVDFPNRGRAGAVENTRELLVAHTPYVIVYRVIGETVWLVDIVHTSTDYPPEAVH